MKNAKEIFLYGLAGLATLCFFALLVIVFFVPLPEPNKEIALLLLGNFAAIVTMIYSYFFGSSKGSSDKTEAMNKAAEELARNTVIKSTEETVSKTN